MGEREAGRPGAVGEGRDAVDDSAGGPGPVVSSVRPASDPEAGSEVAREVDLAADREVDRVVAEPETRLISPGTAKIDVPAEVEGELEGSCDDAPAGTVRAPYQYYGGKATVTVMVWERFGDVPNYVEPFFGSGAACLGRPHPHRIATVNDIDCNIANFWRASQYAPDELAELMNWPVNETDLTARHRWLNEATRKAAHRERMHAEPRYYDVQTAAWWCWGLCQWIGSGWCAKDSVWHGVGSDENAGSGINIRDPERGGKRPHLPRGSGRGVHRQIPNVGNLGKGIHRSGLLGTQPEELGECERIGRGLQAWMRALRDKLRRVRVCCGDWKRVCTDSPVIHAGTPCGIFLDPPYSAEAGRCNDIYAHESADVAHAVREWAIEHGNDPRLRIALCGYEGEHAMPDDWECVAWKAKGGYANQNADPDSAGKANCKRERIWFSPHCRKVTLF